MPLLFFKYIRVNYSKSLMSFLYYNGIQADSTASNGIGNSIILSRPTIDFGTTGFRIDSSRITTPAPKPPVIKTIPYIPVDDSLRHPVYDVLNGDFIISPSSTIEAQLRINPITPIDATIAEQLRQITAAQPKTVTVRNQADSAGSRILNPAPESEQSITDTATNTAQQPVMSTADTSATTGITSDSTALLTAATDCTQPTAPNTVEEYEVRPIERAHKSLFGHTLADNDWMLAVIIASFVIFAWIRMIYGKYVRMLLQSVFNFHTARRMNEESNISLTRVFFALNILFFINISVFTCQCLKYFDKSLLGFSGFTQFGICAAIFVSICALRTIVLKMLDFVFDTQAFGTYNFNIYLYNKIYGLIMLPLIAVIPFVSESISTRLIWFGMGLYTFLYICTLFRGLRICIQKRVSIFYLFFYLCALEILPLLTLLKCILKYNV